MVYCTLHTNMRVTECVCDDCMMKCNTASLKEREEHSRHIRNDCGVTGFHFFGKKNEPGKHGQLNALEWTNLQWPQLKRILYRFDLGRIYGNGEVAVTYTLPLLFTPLALSARLWFDFGHTVMYSIYI